MSGGPTSVAERRAAELLAETAAVDPQVLAAAGWTPEELYWEEVSAAALALPRAEAADYWRAAAEIAPGIFAAEDARRATSLANLALTEPSAERAAALLREAEAIWTKSAAWLEGLRPERRARSSTFHLRLQRKHQGGYAHWSSERYRVMHAEGAQALRARAKGEHEAADPLAVWREALPPGFEDARRLVDAVYLIAPDKTA